MKSLPFNTAGRQPGGEIFPKKRMYNQYGHQAGKSGAARPVCSFIRLSSTVHIRLRRCFYVNTSIAGG
jgi:hypothetical protein